MLKVGLTGGIGSGKSLICRLFSTLGIPVFNADDESKALYDTDSALRNQLKRLLGDEIYEGNVLQRQVMAGKIFADENLLLKVNALVHPLVKEQFKHWVAMQTAPYVLQEAAILFESGFAENMDKTITVSAPETLRIKRVMKRNGILENVVRQRMQQQWTDAQRESNADFVIVNDEQQAVLPQVLQLHDQLIKIKKI